MFCPRQCLRKGDKKCPRKFPKLAHEASERCNSKYFSFTLQPFLLIAVDHCATNNGGCEVTCTSSQDGPVCGCFAGFKLKSDGKNCTSMKQIVFEFLQHFIFDWCLFLMATINDMSM